MHRELRPGEEHVAISGIRRPDGRIEIVQTLVPQAESALIGSYQLGGLEVTTITENRYPTLIVVNPRLVFLEVSTVSTEKNVRKIEMSKPQAP